MRVDHMIITRNIRTTNWAGHKTSSFGIAFFRFIIRDNFTIFRIIAEIQRALTNIKWNSILNKEFKKMKIIS